MSLALLIVISCLAMVVKDAVLTFLTVAEARGRAGLSGVLNALGTPASVVFYSYGATELVHGHGPAGWLGLLPIMCVDMADGWLFTRLSRRIEPDPGTKHGCDCHATVRHSPDQEAHA